MTNPETLPVKVLSQEEVVDKAGHVFEPWQREFARWFARMPRGTAIENQLGKLKELTGYEWTFSQLKFLKSSGLFREYVNVMRERSLAAAKLRIGEIAYEAVEGLAEGIAVTREEKDYATMAKLTGQVLERTMPRRDELVNQRLTINVSLTKEQQALEELQPLDVEIEPLG